MDTYDRIERLLFENGMKQADLAKATGISTGLISQWKNRSQQPSAKKLQIIADYFGVSTDYLLGKEPKEKTPAEADVTFDDFTYAMYGESRGLTEENKNMLLEMARILKKGQQEGK